MHSARHNEQMVVDVHKQHNAMLTLVICIPPMNHLKQPGFLHLKQDWLRSYERNLPPYRPGIHHGMLV